MNRWALSLVCAVGLLSLAAAAPITVIDVSNDQTAQNETPVAINPVNANNLAFGYSGVQDGRLVVFGWLYKLGQPDVQSSQVFGKPYFGSLDEAGARKVAREFAADILANLGVQSLIGSKIFFASPREAFGKSDDGHVTHSRI